LEHVPQTGVAPVAASHRESWKKKKKDRHTIVEARFCRICLVVSPLGLPTSVVRRVVACRRGTTHVRPGRVRRTGYSAATTGLAGLVLINLSVWRGS
jgi:hypothetical protein